MCRRAAWPFATVCHAAHGLLLARNHCGRSRACPAHGAHRVYEEPHGFRRHSGAREHAPSVRPRLPRRSEAHPAGGVEALRLRLPCFVMLDLCQQEIQPLARRPYPPGTLARREAAQGRDLLVGWRGRLPGRYVSPPNWERAGLRSAGTEVTDGAKEGVRFPPRGAEPLRSVRPRLDRPPRLPGQGGEVRGGRHDRQHAARRAQPQVRRGPAGRQGRLAAQGQHRGVRLAERLGQGARLPRAAGQGAGQAARHPGDSREPRPEPAHRGHRPPHRAGELRRLRAGRADAAGRLSRRRGQGARAVREARPGQDPRGLPRRARPSWRSARSATARWARWASAMAAEW